MEDVLLLRKTVARHSPASDSAKIDAALAFIRRHLARTGCSEADIQKTIACNARIVCHLVTLFPEENTLIAALLQDILVHAPGIRHEIADAFGADIALIVADTARLAQIAYTTVEGKKYQEFIQFFISQTTSFSSLFIAIAKRIVLLENAAAGSPLPNQLSPAALAGDSRTFAEMANILGIWRFKSLIEDLIFRILEPGQYDRFARKALDGFRASENLLQEMARTIKEHLRQTGIKGFALTSRRKHIYSIYQKTQRKHTDIDYLFDVNGIRITVPRVKDCYHVLSVISSLYKSVPGRFKDYIQKPKANGYRSIHVGIYHQAYPIEIQIRTQEMDRIAEIGQAAHWLYKNKNLQDPRYQRIYNQIKKQFQALQDNISAQHIDKDTLKDIVHILTPDKRRSIALAKGATVLDFAFAIHTDIGLHCKAGIVNDSIKPMDHVLQNGDTVKILTSARQRPNIDWSAKVHTRRAKRKLQHYLRLQERELQRKRGRDQMAKAFRKAGMNLDKWAKTDQAKEVLAAFHLSTMDDCYEQIGNNQLTARKMLNFLLPEEPPVTQEEAPEISLSSAGINEVVIDNQSNINYRIARCCQPIPGDDTIGYITAEHIISVHKRSCPNIAQLNANKLLAVRFTKDSEGLYTLFLHLTFDRDEISSQDIVKAVKHYHIDILQSRSHTPADKHISSLWLRVKTSGKEQILRLQKRLNNKPGILSVATKPMPD